MNLFIYCTLAFIHWLNVTAAPKNIEVSLQDPPNDKICNPSTSYFLTTHEKWSTIHTHFFSITQLNGASTSPPSWAVSNLTAWMSCHICSREPEWIFSMQQVCPTNSQVPAEWWMNNTPMIVLLRQMKQMLHIPSSPHMPGTFAHWSLPNPHFSPII